MDEEKDFPLMETKKNRLIKGNMWKYRLPRNQYDHILIPRSFFPHKHPKIGKTFQKTPDNNLQFLQILVERLAPALRPHGTLRISHVGIPEDPARYQQLFPQFTIDLIVDPHGKPQTKVSGIILQKKS